jgi:hypothetical protein
VGGCGWEQQSFEKTVSVNDQKIIKKCTPKNKQKTKQTKNKKQKSKNNNQESKKKKEKKKKEKKKSKKKAAHGVTNTEAMLQKSYRGE